MFAMVHVGAIWHKTAELIASAHGGGSVRHCIGEKLPLSARSDIIPLFVAFAAVCVLELLDSLLR